MGDSIKIGIAYVAVVARPLMLFKKTKKYLLLKKISFAENNNF